MPFLFNSDWNYTYLFTKNTNLNVYLFVGSDIRSNSQDFEGREVTIFFGGAESDLRHISITNEAHLKLICLFEEITVFAPENIKIEVAEIIKQKLPLSNQILLYYILIVHLFLVG